MRSEFRLGMRSDWVAFFCPGIWGSGSVGDALVVWFYGLN